MRIGSFRRVGLQLVLQLGAQIQLVQVDEFELRQQVLLRRNQLLLINSQLRQRLLLFLERGSETVITIKISACRRVHEIMVLLRHRLLHRRAVATEIVLSNMLLRLNLLFQECLISQLGVNL